MGGGVVASALANAGKKVLVLEAGSLLFPTHIGNLPRRLLIGQFQKHVWSLWEDFKVINYRNVPGSAYDGGQGFNLGGRSIFWGSFTPPLAAWELDAFPPVVRRYLLDPTPAGGYPLARRVFNADVPVPNRFPDYVGDHAKPAPPGLAC
jgi:choline dehydrogenase-like flavoprotein